MRRRNNAPVYLYNAQEVRYGESREETMIKDVDGRVNELASITQDAFNRASEAVDKLELNQNFLKNEYYLMRERVDALEQRLWAAKGKGWRINVKKGKNEVRVRLG